MIRKLPNICQKKFLNSSIKKTQYSELDRFSAFELTELSQTQDKDDTRIIYVDTRTTFHLKDKDNNDLNGGLSYQQFTVLIENNTWYIINYIEPVSSDWR